MPGQYGFEMDLTRCTEEELNIAKAAIADHKRLEHIIHDGSCYRLRSPFECNVSAVEFVSCDGDMVVLFIDSVKATPNAPCEHIILDGLDENAKYVLEENGEVYGGDYLMNCGILYINNYEHNSRRLIFKKQL